MTCAHCKKEIKKKVQYWAEPEHFPYLSEALPFCTHYCNVAWYIEQKNK